MKNLVITGGTGFIGSHLVKAIDESKYSIYVVSRSKKRPERLENLSNLTLVVESDLSQLFIRKKIYGIIHLATYYGREESDLEEMLNVNVGLPNFLLMLALKHKISFFINTDTFFNTIGQSYSHLNSYTISKRYSWGSMENLASGSNLKLLNLKLFHVYGPNDGESKFTSWICRQMITSQKPIKLTEGKQRRDFIHVNDVVSAYLKVIDQLDEINHFETIQVGTGESHSIKDFILTIEKALKERKIATPKLQFGAIETRKGEMTNSQADSRRLKSLGWSPVGDLKSGVDSILNEIL
jgi:nucleoside-diphosphate-sugar epimerase